MESAALGAALPVVIQTRGVWCLQGNLTWNGSTGRAIDVRESFVTIDHHRRPGWPHCAGTRVSRSRRAPSR